MDLCRARATRRSGPLTIESFRPGTGHFVLASVVNMRMGGGGMVQILLIIKASKSKGECKCRSEMSAIEM
jgi:hypothetical protein